MDAAELGAYIRAHFTHTAYRWECQPAYEVASDGTDYARYLAGEAEPSWDRLRPWLKHLAEEKQQGLCRHRVRLLHDPLHPYEYYECEWGYLLTGGAGEDVRVLDIAEHQLPAELVDHDYWLLDDRHAVRMHYAGDGQFLGATVESEMIDTYRAGRDTAWRHAEPFVAWWQRHPEYRRDVRRKAS
jgi:hypothetical protein